ncbi:hypothetical protein H5T87_10930, partial [bacterium]|nr:hypothetical protein [bacterium]
VPAAQYGADEQRKVINWKQDNTQKWIQAGISTYTKWKWWDGQKYQVEEQVQINQPAEQAIRALKRVACFSWDMHSLDGSNGSIVVFPKKWYWGERSYIAASHNSPGLDKIKDKTIYFISDLPDNSLSHLVCVFILACSGQSGSSGTVDMVDQIYSKGAGFVGTIIGGDLAERTGWLLAKKFWNYAAKGGVDENGKLTPLTLPKALKKAFEEVYSEEGQKKFKPYSRRDGYLWPARGGKDDTALRAMGPTP